ncbi:MAG: hypothetical protein FWD26_09965 [Treponema sp.]|nr:hypothetical protein [Treponema sp.]
MEALQLELEAYKDVLEFHPELQLTTEPLRIDCVVIKKLKEVKIEKTSGQFLEHGIYWNTKVLMTMCLSVIFIRSMDMHVYT